jgi:hypothetical protein
MYCQSTTSEHHIRAPHQITISEHHSTVPPFIINNLLQYLSTYVALLPNTTAPLDCHTKHWTEHRGMFDATFFNHVVAWSKSLQLTNVASCYTKYRSGYLIVRPRIHPPVQSSTPDLYFQSATCHGSVILLHFTSQLFFPVFLLGASPDPSHTLRRWIFN